jgi:uncharacterized protein GlcG (DUF336 family)
MTIQQIAGLRAIALLVLVLMLGGPDLGRAAQAPPPVPAPPSTGLPPSISLPEARVIIEGALGYARQRNVLMAVTVLDQAGNVVSSDRMDGVTFANVRYAEGKAFASVISRQTTESLSELAKTRPDRYSGIRGMYAGKVYLVGGGEPLIVNGQLVGAVGVAGLAQFEDEAAGRAGIAAWERSRGNGRR